MSQRLYVIGNGLDLHHGIRSGHNDFGRFVQAAEPRVFALINDYLAVDHDFWSCFEERLATFDPDSVTDHAERSLASYGADDWSDSSHHDYEYEIEQIVDGISVDLRRLFGTWVRALPMPPPGSFSPVKCIRAEGWFLTFNYTPTLQRLYGIPERNVLHIHGRSSDPDAEIVLGHGWDRSTADMLSPLADEDTDTRVAGGYALIDGYFAATFKPTAEIMQRHHDLFDALGAVTEVVVLGHSLADVDAPYLEAIVSRVSRDCQWTISRHVEPSLEQSRFQQLGGDLAAAFFAPLSSL